MMNLNDSNSEKHTIQKTIYLISVFDFIKNNPVLAAFSLGLTADDCVKIANLSDNEISEFVRSTHISIKFPVVEVSKK